MKPNKRVLVIFLGFCFALLLNTGLSFTYHHLLHLQDPFFLFLYQLLTSSFTAVGTHNLFLT